MLLELDFKISHPVNITQQITIYHQNKSLQSLIKTQIIHMYQPPSWPWCHMEPTKLVRVTFFVFYTLMILVFKQALRSSLGFNGGVVPSLMVAVRRSLFFTEKSRTWKVPYVCKQNSQCCQLYVDQNSKKSYPSLIHVQDGQCRQISYFSNCDFSKSW